MTWKAIIFGRISTNFSNENLPQHRKPERCPDQGREAMHRLRADHGGPACRAPQPGTGMPPRQRPGRGIDLCQSFPVRSERGPGPISARPGARYRLAGKRKDRPAFFAGQRGNVSSRLYDLRRRRGLWTGFCAEPRGRAIFAAWPRWCSSCSTWSARSGPTSARRMPSRRSSSADWSAT